MNANDLVSCVKATLVDNALRDYLEALEKFPRDEVADPYWQSVLKLYDSVAPQEKMTIIEIMRQVTIDSIAGMFGILDGTIVCPHGEEIRVMNLEQVVISGDLQDRFLEDYV